MQFDAFISDPHFGHKNIIKYCNRPFSSAEEQTETLIKNYNEKVSPNETCLWLGDCFFGKNKFCREIMKRLNGRKVLVRGNHDPDNGHDCISRGFDWAVDKMYARWEDRNIVLIHYDQWLFRSAWDDRYGEKRHPLNMERMEVIIHGHTHQKSKVLLNQIHLGVDAWDFAPARYEEVAPLIKAMPDSWTGEMRQELADLKRYRELVSLNAQLQSTVGSWATDGMENQEELGDLPELREKKYDKFRVLGWEKTFEKRIM